ncbi:cysteinyl-tRNA synthetase [Antricoccus suffuscus]|uniref:Cysteine--tRNA ligase n=1 Tax=Antricoccus suffuscus TaxID=1629062 RepID=A0A2T0ZJT5_9ACTN|nr:cysteine--tRNA ligase [Antricoccus suffuscus]PRZ36567.1 cysteinyl-tRNA synthetase [Antricoccus suffuscus]
MAIRLFDSKSRTVRDFVPLEAGKVSMYVCGITVQGPPHIGHMRFAVAFDILRRWMTREGYDVTLVRNVTDIDDKILTKSAEAGVDWWKFAYANERICTSAYDVLGNLPPSYEPRATGHVTEMVELMQKLIDGGHAYAVGGDVYFDVRSWPAYGELTGQKLDELQPASDTETDEHKKDPRDFALWKSYKDGEPQTASWPTPWGRGRPGWHLECSAMARRYLGSAFDIHGGGIDLRFPHHENELAQSSAAGDDFASYWMHNGWVTMGGQKMSKSLGNTLNVDELVKTVRPVDIRYFLAAAHYRSTLEFNDDSFAQAHASYSRLENFVRRANELHPEPVDLAQVEVPTEFAEALNDDLSVSGALAVIFDAVRVGNNEIGPGEATRARLHQVRAMLDIFGLDPLDPHWSGGEEADLTGVVDALVALTVTQRQDARARKDYAAADAIRDELKAAGINIEDSASGTRWTIESGK